MDSDRVSWLVLPNGVRIVAERCPELRVAAVGVWLAAGSRDDPRDLAGLAHLTEHLAFCRPGGRTATEVARELEGLGADINACTEREATAFVVRSVSGSVTQAAPVLVNLVDPWTITRSDLDREREVVWQEIRLQGEAPEARVQDMLAELMFPGQLGQPISGSIASTGRITAGDVAEFVRRWYVPANMVVSVAGDFDGVLLDRLAADFGALPGEGAPPAAGDFVPVCAGQRWEQAPVDQVYLCVGFSGFRRDDDDRVALYALGSLLGEGMSSRLYLRLRERSGMAYSVYSYYNLYRDTGSLVVFAAADERHRERVVDAIVEEVDRLADEVVSPDEVSLARAKLRRNLVFNMQDAEYRMVRLAKEAIWHDRYFAVEELLAMIDGVTSKDIQRAARRIRERGRIAVAGLSP